MNKGKHTIKKYKVVEVYSVLILIATLFMSIGYAKISDIETNIEGEIEANNQEGVFITNIETSDETNTTINYYTGTMVDSKIVLGSTTSSSITYEVTLYNNLEREHIFIGVLTDDTNETLYSNTNIEYTLNGLEKYVTTIAPKERLTFEITFTYAGTNTSNNTLESKLNFRFRELPIIELSNEGQTYILENIYPGYTSQEYEFAVTNYNQTKTNTVPMIYYFETEIDTPLEVKIYDESGNEVTGSISIGGGTQETHTYTAKVIWDSSKDSTSYRGQNYNCNITLKAKPDDEKYLEYVISKEFNVDITTNTKPTVTVATSNIAAKTATITATGSDADGDTLQYTLVVNNKTYGPSTTKTWDITGLSVNQTYSYTVTVTDGYEKTTATDSFTTICTHTYGSWVVTKAATCMTTGTQTRTCTLCRATESQTIAKLTTHTYGSWTVTKAATCTTSGTQKRTCTVTGCTASETGTIAATGHSYGSWTVTKKVTCESDGTQTRTCSACGNVETQTIKATGHVYYAGREEEDECSDCGTYIQHWHMCKNCGYDVSGIIAVDESYHKCPICDWTGLHDICYNSNGDMCHVCGYFK